MFCEVQSAILILLEIFRTKSFLAGENWMMPLSRSHFVERVEVVVKWLSWALLLPVGLVDWNGSYSDFNVCLLNVIVMLVFDSR